MTESELIEGDAELQTYMKDLVKQAKVLELVKLMSPLDIVKSIAISLDLKPIQAAKLAINLMKQAKEYTYPRY